MFYINRKGLLWICKKLFPKKYYIGIFRGFTFSCLFLFLAAGNWFVD
ncbi:DNA-binding protein [Bacillus cereus]|uniref:DNA-binding protein n=1 Tax=Bacillus cereus TaxID=1396 RepID=A0A2C1MV35_BACCE|nr:DNA-binding protein [Bacillus cereus]PGU14042.1 DNA-binding protein [Bacillus cereus]